MEIDLADHLPEGSRVLARYEFGRQVRRILQLDRIDRAMGVTVNIRVPEKLYSLNVSFFRGLFEDSLKYLGEQNFRKKYIFNCTPEIVQNIEDGIYTTMSYIDSEKRRKERGRFERGFLGMFL